MLTLNMLNCKIRDLNNVFDLAWPNSMKVTHKQQFMLFVLYSQYYACWCSDDVRSHGISMYGIESPPKPEYSVSSIRRVNTLRPRQNGRRFADDTFMRIFLNENVRISIKVSLKFVPKGPINNIPALVQIMAWRRSGDKPLFEPMMVSLLTQICVTRPQWVNPVMYTWSFNMRHRALLWITTEKYRQPFNRCMQKPVALYSCISQIRWKHPGSLIQI